MLPPRPPPGRARLPPPPPPPQMTTQRPLPNRPYQPQNQWNMPPPQRAYSAYPPVQQQPQPSWQMTPTAQRTAPSNRFPPHPQPNLPSAEILVSDTIPPSPSLRMTTPLPQSAFDTVPPVSQVGEYEESQQVDESQSQYIDDSSAQPRYQAQATLIESFRPSMSTPRPTPMVPLPSRQFQRVVSESGMSRIGSPMGGSKPTYGKDIFDLVKEINERMINENRELRDKLHDLETGQKALATKSEMVEGVQEMLQPAVQDTFISPLEAKMDSILDTIPEKISKLVGEKVEEIMKRRNEVVSDAKAPQEANQSLNDLLSHLISKLKHLEKVDDILNRLERLPIASLTEFLDGRTVSPELSDQDKRSNAESNDILSGGIQQIQTTLEAIATRLDNQVQPLTSTPPADPKGKIKATDVFGDHPSLVLLPEILALLKDLKLALEKLTESLFSSPSSDSDNSELRHQALTSIIGKNTTKLTKLVRSNVQALTPTPPENQPQGKEHQPYPTPSASTSTGQRRPPSPLFIDSSDSSSTQNRPPPRTPRTTSTALAKEHFVSPHCTRSKSNQTRNGSNSSEATSNLSDRSSLAGERDIFGEIIKHSPPIKKTYKKKVVTPVKDDVIKKKTPARQPDGKSSRLPTAVTDGPPTKKRETTTPRSGSSIAKVSDTLRPNDLLPLSLVPSGPPQSSKHDKITPTKRGHAAHATPIPQSSLNNAVHESEDDLASLSDQTRNNSSSNTAGQQPPTPTVPRSGMLQRTSMMMRDLDAQVGEKVQSKRKFSALGEDGNSTSQSKFSNQTRGRHSGKGPNMEGRDEEESDRSRLYTDPLPSQVKDTDEVARFRGIFGPSYLNAPT